MTDEEKIDDYDRLKLEYTRLHQDYRKAIRNHPLDAITRTT